MLFFSPYNLSFFGDDSDFYFVTGTIEPKTETKIEPKTETKIEPKTETKRWTKLRGKHLKNSL
jgi:hypothetical protein